MRILYSHRIQSRDGQSVHVEELVAALREAGHEVLVVGPSFYAAAGFGGESRLVPLLRRLLPGWLGELAELAYNVPAYRRLAAAARAFQPDLIYERYNLYYLAGAVLARRLGVVFHLEVNAPLAEERSRFGGLRLKPLARWAERFVWHAADRVYAVTGVLREMIAREGVAKERIAVIPNAIVPARFGPRAEADPRGRVVLGFIGFVRPWHGLDRVIASLAEPASATLDLVVVGEGPARAELEAQAAALGLGARVRFAGLAPREDVPGLLAGFDIALQPSAVAYASPLKLFEYMAAGCAIVAPDQPNLREILEHERTALLFDPGEPASMARAIGRLATDAPLRARLGVAARAEIAARDYTWRGNAERDVAMAEEDRARRRAHGTHGLPRRVPVQ